MTPPKETATPVNDSADLLGRLDIPLPDLDEEQFRYRDMPGKWRDELLWAKGWDSILPSP
jgi:hypothetical protein